MKITKKLLGYLNKIFDKDPERFLALRVGYAGAGLTWTVADGLLALSPIGGAGAPLTVVLAGYRLGELVNFISAQPGYRVEYANLTDLSLLSAAVLMDGQGDVSKSNGDHLYGYTSFLWAYMEAHATELNAAKLEIDEMKRQMATTTASGEWLDELGGYYGVPRLSNEVDESYSARIIAEVLRPRGNNVAIEAAIKTFTGQDVRVTDVVTYGSASRSYNDVWKYDGVQLHNSAAGVRYGLFDVGLDYDIINGGEVNTFLVTIRGIIDRLRDAGTHLRDLALQGSALSDTSQAPTDGGNSLSFTATVSNGDTVDAPTDASTSTVIVAPMLTDTDNARVDGLAMIVTTQFTYGGLRTHNGDIAYRGIRPTGEDVGTAGDIPYSGLMRANGSVIPNGSEVADGLYTVPFKGLLYANGSFVADGSQTADARI